MNMSGVSCLPREPSASLESKLVAESPEHFYKILAHRGPRIVIGSPRKANRKSLELPAAQRKVRDASCVFDAAVRKSQSCNSEIVAKATQTARKVQLTKNDAIPKTHNVDTSGVVRRKKNPLGGGRSWSTPSWSADKSAVPHAATKLRATWYGGYETLVEKTDTIVKQEKNKVITVASTTGAPGGGGRRRPEMRPRRRPALDLLLMRSNSTSTPEPIPLSSRLSASVSSLNILPRLSAAVIPLRRGLGSNSELGKSATPLLDRDNSSASLTSTSRPTDGLKKRDFARSAAPLLEQDPSTESLLNSTDSPLRKCETVLALTDAQPQRPVNRLRSSSSNGSVEKVCSRCSSLLSLAASGSRYSLSACGSFVPVTVEKNGVTYKGTHPCKLCLEDLPAKDITILINCGCFFCTKCMQSYVEYEIMNGAYDISCPDSKCHMQGVMRFEEVERLTTSELIEKYRKFRLNHEVSMDGGRAFCPRAGCETVCVVSEGGPSGANNLTVPPKPVLCPTCSHHFCSACSNEWHAGMDCATFSRQQMLEAGKSSTNPLGDGILPAESDLIKWCPMCRVPIEKDEGCAQMMCKRCKHVFCWYCLASLDDDFLLRHYDKGPCKNKLGHSRASVIWHRVQVVGIFAGFGLLLLVASPLLLLAAPCIVCCKCRLCNSNDGKTHDGDEIEGMDIEENNVELEDNTANAEIQSVIDPISE